jgi:hypothetical protein
MSPSTPIAHRESRQVPLDEAGAHDASPAFHVRFE